MTLPTDSQSTTEQRALIQAMYDLHAEGNLEASFQAAIQVADLPIVQNAEDGDEYELLGLVFSKSLQLMGEAGLFALQRRFEESAQQFDAALDMLKNVRWRDHLDTDPIFREFQKLELQAVVQGPLMQASEAMARGSFSEASLKVLVAESGLPELRAILSKETTDSEAQLQATAFSVVSAYFMIGALVHMQNATFGDKLLQASMFFENVDIMLNEFSDIDMSRADPVGIVPVMHAFANAARLRVDAELKASEQDYDGAVKLLTQSVIAFERIAPMINSDMPLSDALREATTNMDGIITQSIRHYSAMRQQQQKLDFAARENAALAQALRALDEKKDEIIREFAQQHMNIQINNPIEIANEIKVLNQTNVTMQNNGLDQILALLSKVPQSEESEKLKKDAEDAIKEKDLEAKIKKVAAVIEGTSKVIDAAAQFVPYGPPVMKALKGVFGMLSALQGGGNKDEDDTLPDTHMA